MRICFILLLAVIVLLVCPTLPRALPSNCELPTPTWKQTVDERKDREERREGGVDVVKKLGPQLKDFYGKQKLSLYLKYQTAFVMSKRIENALMKNKITPDDFWYGLKLDNLKVRWNSRNGYTTNYNKWDNTRGVQDGNPTWKSNLPPRSGFQTHFRTHIHEVAGSPEHGSSSIWHPVRYSSRLVRQRRPMTPVLLLVLIVAVFTSLAAGSSGPPLSKEELCAFDRENARQVIELLEVTPEPALFHHETVYPRILCFAVSYSAQHQTRVRAVAETWGQRCDKLLFFSNMSDTIIVAADTPAERRFDVVQLDIIADHAHLWLRTRAALKYLYDNFRHDYDWFYKCDDDTYAIVENMRAYLKRPEVLQRFNREPMHMGHRFSMPMGTLDHYIKNETLRSQWHSRFDRMVYNSGGAGYVMNRLYLDKIVESLPEWTCLPEEASGTMPEDAGVAFCMMWNDVYPWDTRDHRGRERWHAFSPQHLFLTLDDPDSWYVKYHQTIGGVRSQFESAAPDSVAFHYAKPPLMYHLERSLYLCRSDHDDIEAFNENYGLAIGEQVMVV
ncbi:Fringe-like [Phytophthora cactorum]|nr:Fringe-like [Phytophthora cactorum]